tara:strand:- start:15121 stop:15537 length:417 start_codon:yes stop_codon:yes gene_type:complete
MTEDNLKIAMGVAIIVLLYLLTKKNKTATTVRGGPLVSPGPGAGQAQARRTNSLPALLADAIGIKARRMEPNEDAQVHVGKFDNCPAGMQIADSKKGAKTHGPGSCHVTCGGGGWCGDDDGVGDEGKIMQVCCVPKLN